MTTTEGTYKDIKKVELKEALALGKRTSGIGDFKLMQDILKTKNMDDICYAVFNHARHIL